ncbi:hypothetical protein Tco_0590655 [Tanacetum coccineum]
MELVLEQTQQGTSYEVSVSAKGVEELKRKVKKKGEKKEALLTLRLKPERFDTSAGNPVKEILLKLNLPDHRILKDGHGGRTYQSYNDINIELSMEFLVELRKNIYHETYNKDVVDHIAKNGGLVKEMKKITTWEELVKKFFCRFYPESNDEEYEMLDEGEN